MNILTNLFTNVLLSSALGSLLIGLVLITKKLFKSKLKQELISLLWTLVILRLLLPVMIESPVHIGDLFKSSETLAEETPSEVITTEVLSQPSVNSDYYGNDDLTNNETFEEAYYPVEENISTIVTASTQTPSLFENIIELIKSINLVTAGLLIWLAGMVFVLIHSSTHNLVFKSYIAHNSKNVDDETIIDILKKQKSHLSIKRNVKILTCNGISMPLTYSLLSPKILLPKKVIESFETEQIQSIIAHELCHIKRMDIIKGHILIFAKAIHWFNPLVHISIKHIKSDIEFACDEMVVKNRIEKMEYSTALLEVAKMMDNLKVPHITTTLMENKSHLKERITRIMKPIKKSVKLNISILIIALIVMLGCFTTACQSQDNTENDPYTSKTQINKITTSQDDVNDQTSYQENTYEAPKSLSYELTTDGGDNGAPMDIIVDAEVIIPENALPVVKVQPKQITYEQLKTVLDLYVGGTHLYDESFAEQYRLKSNIQHQIDVYNWEIEMVEQEPDGEEYVTLYSGLIEELEKELETAPETYAEAMAQKSSPASTETASTGTLAPGTTPMPIPVLQASSYDGAIEISKNNFDSSRFDLQIGEGFTADTISFDVGTNAEFKQNITYEHTFYEGARSFNINNKYVPSINIMDGFSLSKDDAIAVAQPIANSIDPTLELTDVFDAVYTDFLKDNNPSYPFGYTMIYTRKYNGVNAGYTQFFPLYTVYSESTYERPLQQEYLSITVGVDGVQKLEYYSPVETVETLSENVELLPFDQIEEIFKENIVVGSEQIGGKLYVKIKRVELGLMKVYYPDANEYIVTPVWNFYGKAGGEEVDWSQLTELYNRSYLTINAIDGSIINHIDRYNENNVSSNEEATPTPMISTPTVTP